MTAGTGTSIGLRIRDNAGTDRLTMLDNGNVGIGTTSPDTKLRVEGEVKSIVGGTTFYMVPTGTIVMYGGASAPAGWLLCDGSAVSRTTYANLFAAIGTSYGSGDGSTTFNLPAMLAGAHRLAQEQGQDSRPGFSATPAEQKRIP